MFCVDEVVIFDDGNFSPPPDTDSGGGRGKLDHDSYTGYTDPNYFLAHILSYLECPPYLRMALFPRHPDLQSSGMLPSLDMPHHAKWTGECKWREGVALEAMGSRSSTPINVGQNEPVFVSSAIPAHSRVTVRTRSDSKGEAVSPSEPREEEGWYWGYTVRAASSLSNVLTECPFDGGYNLTVGTSERGKLVSEIASDDGVPGFDHLLVVFGGVAGIEVAVNADPELKKLDLESPEQLFDYWVNLVPGQGSRTIRTEEAVWLGLMALKDIASSKGRS